MHASVGTAPYPITKRRNKDRKQRSEVVYTNKTDANLREFKNDLQTMFGVDMATSGESITVKSCGVAEMLEEQFGSVGTGDWTVRESIGEFNRREEARMVGGVYQR